MEKNIYSNKVIVADMQDYNMWSCMIDDDVCNGQGLDTFVDTVDNIDEGIKIVFVYNLCDFVKYCGEDAFDTVIRGKSATWKNTITRAFVGDIDLRNLKPLSPINVKDVLPQSKQVVDMYLKTYKTVDNIPLTLASHVERLLGLFTLQSAFNDALKIKKNNYKLYVDGKHAPLCGYNDILCNSSVKVWGYDIKSSYPRILMDGLFPAGQEQYFGSTLDNKVTSDLLNQWLNNGDLFIGLFEFENPLQLKQGKLPYLKNCEIDGVTRHVFTSVDLKNVLKIYKCKLKKIPYLIHYTDKQVLPTQFRNNVYKLFMQKESATGEWRDFYKTQLNMLYGIYCMDPVKYKMKNINLFPMAIGTWTLSYGRDVLYKAMEISSDTVVSWDTDGFKSIIPLDINELNAQRKQYKNKLGAWVEELKAVDAIVTATKQYFLKRNGKWEVHCAGLCTDTAEKYINDNKLTPHRGLKIPGDYSGHYTIKDNVKIFTTFTIGSDEILIHKLVGDLI